ncbi:MAG: Ig-like domain repeat protein [Terriglobia bacterium]
MRISRSPFLPTGLAFAFILFIPPAKASQTTRAPARITQAVDDENRVTLRGNIHPLARSEYDRGLAPDNQPVRRILLLLQRAPEQELALRKLLDEQQTKSSPNYHHWLTPEQLGQQFGPADADIQAVNDWLIRQGFEVNRVTAGRTAIEFSGTAGIVRQSLHAEIHKYVVNGEEHWANAGDPQIPAALAPVVAGFASLNNFPRKPLSHRLGTFSRSKITGEIKPLFTFGSSPTKYAVGPGDFATIYNVPPPTATTDGSGQTIAIVGDSNINIQDVRDFRTMFGLPTNDPHVILDGPDPGNLGGNEEGEADLDVEWAGAVARGATIDLVVSETTESTQGTDLSALYIIDNNLAPVMSVSFGQCEAELGSGGNAFYNAMWEQAAAQGITVLVASGDSGSAGCDAFTNEKTAQAGLSVSGVASTPFNVAVGGTDFDDAGNQSQFWSPTNSSLLQNSALSYIPEITWNDSCAQTGLTGCASVASRTRNLVGGGGGPSNCINPSGSFPSFTCGAVNSITGYARPLWQRGTGVPADNARDIPDVSLFAADGKNGSFYIMCQSDAITGSSTSCNLSPPFTNFVGVGGTSVSTPAFAGIMALVNQKTGQRQGNANYVLYKLAAQSGASCASNATMAAGANTSACIFYDTVTGNNSVACAGGSPNCSSTTSGQIGNLVTGTATSQLAAWTTTAGFDLATGLGSVNAANLVSKWASFGFSPTTTTLANLSPTTITHGQSVNVTINVSSTSPGTSTGTVSLLGSQPSGVASFTLNNGTAFGTTTFLPGGTYNVTAHYPGDGSFGASDSSPVQVTVNKESSQTQLGLVTFDLNGNVTSTTATTAAYGSPYVLRVNVTNSTGQQCASNPVPCPTGTVTLTDNGQALDGGTFGLNSQGHLEDQPIQLTGGLHSVVATYSGDNSYMSPSQPTTDMIAITPAVTTTSLTTNASTVQSGASVTLTAVVNTQSNGAAPTGTVQFLNASTPIPGTVAYTGTPFSTTTGAFASLQAVLTTTFSATATITAQYNSGDANYAGSTSTAATVTVTTAPPDFTFTASPTVFTISSQGQSGTSTLTVSPTNGFTGTVSFTCAVPAAMSEATCSLAPASVTTTGTTTLTVTTTAPHAATVFFHGPGWFVGGCAAIIICLLLLSIPAKRRQWKTALGLASVVILAAGIIACGGGSSSSPPPTTDPGTPVGTYIVTVTATSGSLSHTSNVSVTVL